MSAGDSVSSIIIESRSLAKEPINITPLRFSTGILSALLGAPSYLPEGN